MELTLIDRTKQKQVEKATTDRPKWHDFLENLILDRLPSCFHISAVKRRFSSKSDEINQFLDGFCNSRRLEPIGDGYYHVRW